MQMQVKSSKQEGRAYHRDLLEALRHPSMWQALGWPGPPIRIRHSSLQDNLSSMQLLH